MRWIPTPTNPPLPPRPFCLAGVLALAILAAISARADVIHLKNGHTLDGIIIKETEDSVVLDIGLGNTTIKRARIERIEKSDRDGQQKIRKAWREKYSSHKKYAPERFEALAAEFRSLGDKRNVARKSSASRNRRKAAAGALRGKLAAAESAYEEINRQLHAATDQPRRTREDVNAYNRMITSNNLLRAEMKKTVEAINDADAAILQSFASTHAFSDALARFKPRLDAAMRTRDLAPEEREFLAGIGKKVEGYDAEFVRHEIPHRRSKGAVLVDVKLNRIATGTFLLDTGASVVTLSPQMAARLRLKSSGPKVEMVVADGTRVAADPVLLTSVSVGAARAENVPAVIMPNAPGKGLDGLLGMTFLRELQVQIDPASGKVQLYELR